jgi:hypothetical protein
MENPLLNLADIYTWGLDYKAFYGRN